MRRSTALLVRKAAFLIRNADIFARRAAILLALGWVTHGLGAQGAVLDVHTARDQTTFHIGERIPLELRFTAPAESKLLLNNASYDRSGRMMHEAFTVTPGSGWADPLKTYFGSLGGMMMGGISGLANLSPEPTVVSIDLNEWVRFDAPGDYRITVSSDRVSDPASKGSAFGRENSITAAPLALHIVPATEAWQAERLKVIQAVLGTTEANTNVPSDARRRVIADLRYLQSKAAIAELAANLREDRPDLMSPSAFGLIGLPPSMHDVAVSALQDRIDDPRFPVCGWLLETFAVLHAGSTGGRSAERVERNHARDDAWREVLHALPRKEGEARALTAQTLLGDLPADLDAETRQQLARVLAASLLDLPEEKRSNELQWHWDALRSVSMLPALKSSATLPLAEPGSNRMDLYTRRGLKSVALARWYELDPVGATQEALAQIGSAHPSLTAESLYFMPKQQLPQFEAVWAQAFLAATDFQQQAVLAGLLVRFGTGAATGTVAAKLQDEMGQGACAPQAAALAYLVKFDPAEAEPLLHRAADPGSPGTSHCYAGLFQEVSRYAFGPTLNDAAVAALDSPDQRETMDALIYLAHYGRKQDKEPIWKHYVTWHERWQGKGEALDSNVPELAEEHYLGRAVGENLARALVANQGWIASASEIARVMQMCVGEQMCSSLQQVVSQTSMRTISAYSMGPNTSFHVAQYDPTSIEQFEEKIAQFEKGTTFTLPDTRPHTEAQDALELNVRQILAEHGMTLLEGHAGAARFAAP